MALQRMDHIGVTVEDLEAAIAFFTELGLEVEGRWTVGGDEVDRITGLEGVESHIAMLRVPNGPRALELCSFASPPSENGHSEGPVNARGLRHLCFEVDDLQETISRLEGHGAEPVGEVVNYEEYGYELCYLRGPEGIIVELAEKTG